MKKLILIIAGLVCTLVMSDAQSRMTNVRPQWLRTTPVCKDNPDILFIPVTVNETYSKNIHGDIKVQIHDKLPVRWKQSRILSDDKKHELKEATGGVEGYNMQKGESYILADGGQIEYRQMLIDEYRGYTPAGVEYSALYQIVPLDGTPFRVCHVTDRYGAAGAFLSIIPGVGQFYKGDALKGGIFMGGCVLGGVGIVFTEMQRQAYISQMSQTQDINVIRQLDANQRNLGIARNVCIGVTAALYVWNIFDAAIAPGAKRVKITNRGIQYNF